MFLKLCAASLVLALAVDSNKAVILEGLDGTVVREPVVRRTAKMNMHESVVRKVVDADGSLGEHQAYAGGSSSAIVYLANDGNLDRGRKRKQCPTIYDSLHSLKAHMPRTNWNQTKIIIMHESGKMLASNMDLIRAAAPCDVLFKTVDLYDADMALFQDRIHRQYPISYLQMCNFWASRFFKLSFLPEYVMRMDTDSCLRSDMPNDPFERMRRGNIKYMWHSKTLEDPTMIEGLGSFVEKHGGDLDDYGPNDLHEFGNISVYSTNLEWLHMPSFREPAITKWTEQVLHNGGIWMHRWGDAPLRTIAVNQFMKKPKVLRFCEFEYAHSFWPLFKRCTSENPEENWHWR